MRIFRRRKTPTGVQKKASTLLNDLFRMVQSHWVRCMQKVEKRFSFKQKKIGLLFFCGLATAYCILILVDAFSVKESIVVAIPTTPLLKQSDISVMPTPTLSSTDSFAVKRFRHLIDSMNDTDSGKLELQILNEKRPGLLDSFYLIEKTIE